MASQVTQIRFSLKAASDWLGVMGNKTQRLLNQPFDWIIFFSRPLKNGKYGIKVIFQSLLSKVQGLSFQVILRSDDMENFSLVREGRGKGMTFQSVFLKKILLNNGVQDNIYQEKVSVRAENLTQHHKAELKFFHNHSLTIGFHTSYNYISCYQYLQVWFVQHLDGYLNMVTPSFQLL